MSILVSVDGMTVIDDRVVELRLDEFQPILPCFKSALFDPASRGWSNELLIQVVLPQYIYHGEEINQQVPVGCLLELAREASLLSSRQEAFREAFTEDWYRSVRVAKANISLGKRALPLLSDPVVLSTKIGPGTFYGGIRTYVFRTDIYLQQGECWWDNYWHAQIGTIEVGFVAQDN